MNTFKIDLPDETGKVVSIEVAKHTTRYGRRLFNECEHYSIEVDPTLAAVTCKLCGKEINPVQWIMLMAEEWHRIKRLSDEYKKQADRVEERSKVKCRICGKMTPIGRP